MYFQKTKANIESCDGALFAPLLSAGDQLLGVWTWNRTGGYCQNHNTIQKLPTSPFSPVEYKYLEHHFFSPKIKLRKKKTWRTECFVFNSIRTISLTNRMILLENLNCGFSFTRILPYFQFPFVCPAEARHHPTDYNLDQSNHTLYGSLSLWLSIV